MKGVVVTSGTSIYLYDFATGETARIFEVNVKPGMGFKDGKVDRQGASSQDWP